MHRKRRPAMFFSRYASLSSGWWRKLRWRWYVADKALWIFAGIVGLVVAGFGVLLATYFTQQDERRALTCLALNVYFEARGESKIGQYAVAEVTMNRVTSGRYPNTVCGVVYQKNWDPLRKRFVGAFSWTEFDTRPSPKTEEWQRVWEVAEEVFYGRHARELDGALFYHSIYIKPSWAKERKLVARVGKHVFYK